MSKFARDIVEEFQSLDVIEGDFELFVLLVTISEAGDINSTESIEPISRIEADDDNQECLLHISSNNPVLRMDEVTLEISSLNPSYSLCAAREETIDDSWVRIDNPIIGFGENI